MSPVAKKQPLITLSLSDGTEDFFKKFLKTLYGNVIGLKKRYKSIYLFPNLVSVKKMFGDFKLRTF